MPHKHTRRVRDESTFDLPPTQVAKSLPVTQTSQKKNDSRNPKAKQPTPEQSETKSLKRKRETGPKNDAPRAFKRLMASANGKKPRSGLDNGDAPRKGKGKRGGGIAQQAQTSQAEPKAARSVPTIRPGERLSEFSARVDAALPLAGLVNKSQKGNKDPLGLKAWQTKKEKKMHKMYDEWREQDRKTKEKREEEQEQQEEKDLEDEENGVSWKLHMPDQTAGKGKKRFQKDDEDPWEALRRKRGEVKPGLHDVALAPPEFTVKPTKQLFVRGAAVQVGDIPKAAGSLKRREELHVARNDVVAAYRKKMGEKRSPLQVG
ncbi:hypothetical protein F5Y16DRAFT_183810 [Xylariaceae sp. FL0255]|nr:hypothetical protein F5Y16DRAFT_183810 [Xylariaceae sp. FL0255]